MGTEFTPIFLFILVAIMIAVGDVGGQRLARSEADDARSSRCRTSRAWTRSAMPGSGSTCGIYLVAIVFLLFDVELLFLYPWAVAQWSAGSRAVAVAQPGR